MTIALIGAGNMGEAILAGVCNKYPCVVCEPRVERRAYLTKKYRCSLADTPAQAAVVADIVLLAVKPQDLPGVLADIKPVVKKQVFVSIAAGITSAFIEKSLGGKVRVVRSMPNLPALIREGMTGVCKGRYAAVSDLKKACDILASVGQVMVVPEKMIDAVTAVSGSGPAYVFLFVECLMQAARKLGFNEAQAKTLVLQTLLGSVHMAAGSKDSAGVLRQKVTSKGGTTQAAMDVFMARGVFDIYLEALTAAKQRARELAQ